MGFWEFADKHTQATSLTIVSVALIAALAFVVASLIAVTAMENRRR